MTYHGQWAAEGQNVAPGSPGYFDAFSRPWQPVLAYPAAPASTIGRKVGTALATLRELRKRETPKQIGPPRKPRTRREGELSLTEFASRVCLGPRELRKRLLAVGLLQTEIEVRDRGGRSAKYLHTARLTEAAVRGGLGRRLEPRSGPPYDVLTPKGLELATALLREEVRKPNRRREVREEVRQLLERGKSQAEISRLTGLSKQRVHYVAKRAVA